MNLEIHKPEPIQRLNARIQTGQFHDADELLEKALDALDEKSPPPVTPHGSLHEFFMYPLLRGANLDLERVRDYPLVLDLE